MIRLDLTTVWDERLFKQLSPWLKSRSYSKLVRQYGKPSDICLERVCEHPNEGHLLYNGVPILRVGIEYTDDGLVVVLPSDGSNAGPTAPEYLLYLFLDAKNCDALVGDLEERYKLIRKKFGARRADFWYWKQVIWSLAPLGWAATKRLMKAATGVAALVEVWRRTRG